jgi:hypothetical protein
MHYTHRSSIDLVKRGENHNICQGDALLSFPPSNVSCQNVHLLDSFEQYREVPFISFDEPTTVTYTSPPFFFSTPCQNNTVPNPPPPTAATYTRDW